MTWPVEKSTNDGTTTQQRLALARRLGGHQPGTDVTASLWQVIQHTTIQHQLNATHEMYNWRSAKEEKKTNWRRGGSTCPKNVYGPIMETLKRKPVLDRGQLFQFLRWYVPTPPAKDGRFLTDVNIFDKSLTNLCELRRAKVWCKYMLTDGIIRYGCIQKHPLYNGCPGWLMDILELRRRGRNLALLWCTDIRGVNDHMGSVCSLINLHHLFQRIERVHGDNFTALLAHLTVLSTAALNPINRRGLKYPSSSISSRTFENVRRSLLRKCNNNETDTLVSYFTRIMMVMPHKIGTNFMDLVIE